eukprot:TRINITY_DN9839_c0_g1_i6.p1 TRINITY_DN9839_c0_g1~~TRINITY_DN9839_c0_g1_i6.p1  ORF type:complete len:767 (+),score=207.85 TRINITY_DN9839_c0_g1_i6:164-2464(+)
MASSQSDNVKVIVRCRPLNSKEVETSCKEVVSVNHKRKTISVEEEGTGKIKPFTFDAAYGKDSTQKDVYEESAKDIVADVLNGFNGTIFAYGQTGTGKTWTMMGDVKKPDLRGIIPQAFSQIFDAIESSTGCQYLVRASYLEVYMEKVRDLLSKDHERSLKVQPSNGHVKDLTSIVVKNQKEITKVMQVGDKNRRVGVTNMNARSSRSHAIFMIQIECSEIDEDGQPHIRSGRLNLVDLAGSERINKTGATGEQQQEGIKINLSLTSLGHVIKALVERSSGSHIPYRASVLTTLLQDSLGGNAKTMMVATVGPADYNFAETIGTLQYAQRAKKIKNKPVVNEDPKDALLREYQEEILRLKSQLQNGGKKIKKKKSRKKKIRFDENGEQVEAETESDGDGEVEYIADEEEEARIRQAELEKLEKDRQAMMADHTMLQEDKDKLLADLDARTKEIQKEQRQAAELAAKIKTMESKLLVGGKSIAEHTAEQERQLRARQKQIQDQDAEAARLKRALEEKEERRLAAEESFTSLAQEVEVKTRKLQKIWEKLKMAKEDIEAMHDEFAQERVRVQEMTDAARKQLRLKQLIIEHFIPEAEAEKLKARAFLDEERGEWQLAPITQTDGEHSSVIRDRPRAAKPGAQRAVTVFAQMQASIDRNPRYKSDNIMTVELDMPEKTTTEYTGSAVNARVKDALDNALKDEEDVVIGQSTDDFLDEVIRKTRRDEKMAARARKRPGTAKGSKGSRARRAKPGVADDEQFPTSRGLVRT